MTTRVFVMTRSAKIVLLASLTALVLIAITSPIAGASTVIIHDQSGVLDASKVRPVAAQLRTAALITTTRTFTGDENGFEQQTSQLLPNQHTISIGVDTVHRLFAVEAGTAIPLSNDQANAAYEAFKDNFSSGGYTGAMIAALNSLYESLVGNTQNDITPLGRIVGIIVLVPLGGILIFGIIVTIRSLYRYITTPRPYSSQPGSYSRNSYSSYYSDSYSSHSGYGGGAGGSFGGGDSGGGGSSGGGAGGHF